MCVLGVGDGGGGTGGRGTEPKITVCLQWTTVGTNVGIFIFFFNLQLPHEDGGYDVLFESLCQELCFSLYPQHLAGASTEKLFKTRLKTF